MEKIINSNNVQMFAHTNEELIKGKINGIMLSFHGLNNTTMINEHAEPEMFCADNGILYVFPYYDPWGWMNVADVKYVDDIIDAIIEKFGLPNEIKIASTGGSMGGLSALVYTKYAKRTPVCCAANSPVCDLVTHYTERPDLPRTIYHAFSTYEGTLDEAMRSASPLHLVDELPNIPYYIVHGTADAAVNKGLHSDIFVAEMKKAGKDIVYDEVDGMRHCKLDFNHQARFYGFILSNLT